jgi:hypothetical protein
VGLQLMQSVEETGVVYAQQFQVYGRRSTIHLLRGVHDGGDVKQINIFSTYAASVPDVEEKLLESRLFSIVIKNTTPHACASAHHHLL